MSNGDDSRDRTGTDQMHGSDDSGGPPKPPEGEQEPEGPDDPEDEEMRDPGSGIPTWLGVLAALFGAVAVFVLVAWPILRNATTATTDFDDNKQKTAQKETADPDEQSEERKEPDQTDSGEPENEEEPLKERVKVRLKKKGVWKHVNDYKGLIGATPSLALEHCADVDSPGDCGDLVEIAYWFENEYVVSNRIQDIRERHQKDSDS
ncbi:MAG: hypothetical protein ABEJ02_00245 [Candidatus Paceibacteria bacterium]